MARDIDPRLCRHGDIEQLADRVSWCPACGSQFAATQEEIDRIHDLFMAKLAAAHPNHPWIELDKRRKAEKASGGDGA